MLFYKNLNIYFNEQIFICSSQWFFYVYYVVMNRKTDVGIKNLRKKNNGITIKEKIKPNHLLNLKKKMCYANGYYYLTLMLFHE